MGLKGFFKKKIVKAGKVIGEAAQKGEQEKAATEWQKEVLERQGSKAERKFKVGKKFWQLTIGFATTGLVAYNIGQLRNRGKTARQMNYGGYTISRML